MNRTNAMGFCAGMLLAVWTAVGCGGTQEQAAQETSAQEESRDTDTQDQAEQEPPAQEEPRDTDTGEVQGGLGIRGEPKKGALMGNEVKGGFLSKEEIRKTVHANIQQVRDCYETALTSDPDISGKVSIKFIIALDGTVTMAAVADTEIDNPICENCIAQAVKSWQFPAPDGGIVIVTYPFRLTMP